MSTKESTTRTLMVALAVSLVSSVFVAGAAVSLKPVQIENRQLDKQRSILSIAGLGGDGMLDRYWFGDVSRISPEAPVPVVKVERTEERPGGADFADQVISQQ